MRELRQAQTGDQRQHTCIGDGTCIVDRAGFSAKGKRNRLGLRASGQIVDRIPGCHQGEHQQQHKGHTYCKGRIQKRQALNGQGT